MSSAITQPVDHISEEMSSGRAIYYEQTNVSGVVCRAKNQFWRSVVTRTDVADVWFAGNKDLCRAKIANDSFPFRYDDVVLVVIPC